MKKLMIIALSVMVIAGATAQQRTQQSAKVITASKTSAENNDIKADQGTSTQADINADDIKAMTAQKKDALVQQVTEQKEALTEKVTNVTENNAINGETSLSSAVGADIQNGTVTADVQSATGIDANGNVANHIGTANDQVQSTVKDVKNTVNAAGTTITDIAPKVDANVKTDVATQINVKPVKVNTKITSGTGIKL